MQDLRQGLRALVPGPSPADPRQRARPQLRGVRQEVQVRGQPEGAHEDAAQHGRGGEAAALLRDMRQEV